MIDFKEMRTTERTYTLVPVWNCEDLEFALEVSGEKGWKFLECDDVPEEIRKNYSEKNMEYGRFFVSDFDVDAIGAIIPYIRYDMDVQRAREEQDYQEMREIWDAHRGKAGDLWDGSWGVDEIKWDYECVEDGGYYGADIEPTDDMIYEGDDIFDEVGGDQIYRTLEDGPFMDYYKKEMEENDITEEALEYDRKRDGRRYISSTAADFVSGKCEEETVETFLKDNEEAIAAWLIDENANGRICFEYNNERDSLSTVARHGDSVLCSYLNMSYEIVLIKDKTNDLGYCIDDIYVVITEYMKEFDARKENVPVRKYYSASPEEIEKKQEEYKKFSEKIKNMDIFE